VARIGHVWIDSTMGTVCPSSLLRSLVDLDVGDDELFGIETLRVGVGFSVLEETEEEFGRLLWPTTKSRTEMFGLSRSSSATVESSHGDTLLLLPDVLEVDESPGELHAADGLSGLTSVLEGHTEVGAARFGGLGGVLGDGCVSDHFVGDGRDMSLNC